MFISVTRLRIRAFRFLPGFAYHAYRSQRQVARAPGFLAGSVLGDRKRTFWTLSSWDSAESMRAYMMTGAHREAMPRLAHWCDEASVVHWEQAGENLPSWTEAAERMRLEGRPSKVRRPSPHHEGLNFSPPRVMAATPITPAR